MSGSLQRRRGEPALIHLVERKLDHRGNATIAPTGATVAVRAAFIPDRSARAEVPGQMHIDVVNMLTDADLSQVNIWSRVEWAGRWWDAVSPPSLHVGNRHTRHWTITLRARVDSGGLPLTGWAETEGG